jgi:sugar phosphate permease
MVWILVRNKPQDLGWPALSEIDHQGPGHSAPPKNIPLLEGVKRVFSEPYFIPVAIWFALTPGIFFAFGGLWAGPYLMHVYGITREGAGGILNMIAVGMIIGSPLLSIISERYLYSRKKVLMIVSAGMLSLMVFLNVFPQGLPIYSLYIIFLLFSISSSAIVVIGFTTTKELFPVEIAGTSVGTMNLFPFLGGAILQPVLGRILEAYPKTAPGVYSLSGYRAMLAVLLIGSLIAFLATFFIKETFPGRSE